MHRSTGNTIRTDRDGPSHFVRAYRCAAGHVVGSSRYVLGRPAPAKLGWEQASKFAQAHSFYLHTDVTDRYSFNELR